MARTRWTSASCGTSMATRLRPPAAWPWCWPTGLGNAQPWTGIDWARCVLGEQRIATHRPLPAAGRIANQLRVTRITDKGWQFGAMLHAERTLHDADNGTHYATLSMVTICRGDGGFGGPPTTRRALPGRPGARPTSRPNSRPLPQQALLFDLHGIVNFVHSWPAAARQAATRVLSCTAYADGPWCSTPSRASWRRMTPIASLTLSARFRGVFYPARPCYLPLASMATRSATRRTPGRSTGGRGQRPIAAPAGEVQ